MNFICYKRPDVFKYWQETADKYCNSIYTSNLGRNLVRKNLEGRNPRWRKAVSEKLGARSRDHMITPSNLCMLFQQFFFLFSDTDIGQERAKNMGATAAPYETAAFKGIYTNPYTAFPRNNSMQNFRNNNTNCHFQSPGRSRAILSYLTPPRNLVEHTRKFQSGNSFMMINESPCGSNSNAQHQLHSFPSVSTTLQHQDYFTGMNISNAAGFGGFPTYSTPFNPNSLCLSNNPRNDSMNTSFLMSVISSQAQQIQSLVQNYQMQKPVDETQHQIPSGDSFQRTPRLPNQLHSQRP